MKYTITIIQNSERVSQVPSGMAMVSGPQLDELSGVRQATQSLEQCLVNTTFVPEAKSDLYIGDRGNVTPRAIHKVSMPTQRPVGWVVSTSVCTSRGKVD